MAPEDKVPVGRVPVGHVAVEWVGPDSVFGCRLFPLLETLDADKDGKLSQAEIDDAVAALKKLDKDGDGKLSKEEIGWPPAGMGRSGRGWDPVATSVAAWAAVLAEALTVAQLSASSTAS